MNHRTQINQSSKLGSYTCKLILQLSLNILHVSNTKKIEITQIFFFILIYTRTTGNRLFVSKWGRRTVSFSRVPFNIKRTHRDTEHH